ncbi:MAG: hypothetical protein L6R35_006256, partial [Caloplaca aegaea]
RLTPPSNNRKRPHQGDTAKQSQPDQPRKRRRPSPARRPLQQEVEAGRERGSSVSAPRKTYISHCGHSKKPGQKSTISERRTERIPCSRSRRRRPLREATAPIQAL